MFTTPLAASFFASTASSVLTGTDRIIIAFCDLRPEGCQRYAHLSEIIACDRIHAFPEIPDRPRRYIEPDLDLLVRIELTTEKTVLSLSLGQLSIFHRHPDGHANNLSPYRGTREQPR